MKFRIKALAVLEYDVNPAHYAGASTPQEMLQTDVNAANEDVMLFIDNQRAEWSITGEIVEPASQVAPDAEGARADALRKLIAEGLTYSEAQAVFAEKRSEQELNYVNMAREKHVSHEGNVEVDDGAIVSLSSDGGAYVQAWTWVSDPEPEEPGI